MLMYGTYENMIDTGLVYNLTSMKEGYERLSLLVPPNNIGRLSGRDFDLAYANYIFNNDAVFVQFFYIILALYNDMDIYLMVSNVDWSENLIESLMKLIQQRYGYNGVEIKSQEDYIYYRNSMKDLPEFNPFYGIHNLDMDKERYMYIRETIRLQNGGPIIEEQG